MKEAMRKLSTMTRSIGVAHHLIRPILSCPPLPSVFRRHVEVKCAQYHYLPFYTAYTSVRYGTVSFISSHGI